MDERQQKAKKKPKKKPNFLMRVILFLIALVMVLAAVAAIAFRDSLNLDSVKRWFRYRSMVLNDSGRSESFAYDGTLGDSFAVLDGDLLVCSKNTISLYSGSGACYVSQSVSMSTPVVDTNGSLAVVYDAGGSSLYVLGQRELIWSTTELNSILSAHLNRNGQLTVLTQSSGYRGTATVYDASYTPVVSVNLSSAFVMDVALSDDGKTLGIITVGQDSGAFASTLELYTLSYVGGDYSPDLTCSLGSTVVLESLHTASSLWTVGDRGLNITDHEGNTIMVDWSDKYLKRYSLDGDGFAVALLGKYRAGSQAELWVVNSAGEQKSMDINEQVLAISAAGRYFAVLTGNRLDIYTRDMELYRTLDSTQGARNTLLMSDGSAILISSDSAGFYVP